MKILKKINNQFIYLMLLLLPMTLVAETNPSSNFFGTDVASDGPITICSDQLHYDKNQNILIYEGNVIVMQINGIKLSCNPLAKKLKTANFASLLSQTPSTDYNLTQQRELNIAQKLCAQKGQCRYMSGQKLIVYMNEDGKAKKIQMLTDDKKEQLPVAKYYSLSTNQKNKQTASYAYSKLMEFQPQKDLLILEKNAYIKQKNNSFSGEKITYNTKTEIVNVPKNNYQRATMIISQDETNHDRKTQKL